MSEYCRFKLLLGTGVLTCGLLFAGAPPQSSDPQKQPPQAGAQQSPTKAVEEILYGNTPEELKPFGRFVKEPYKRYFVPGDSPVMFWGPGREKAIVDPTTLKSIKIGVIAPIERSYETYVGRSVVRGMQIALDDANAAGGFK